MPKFTRHVDIGTLRLNNFGYVLEQEGGGFWVLETWDVRRVDLFLDQCVTVEGTRVGFNILSVDRMWREGEPRPLTPMEKLRAWWRTFYASNSTSQ
jgi:hypothetical protein